MREEEPEFKIGDRVKICKSDTIFDASMTPAIIMTNPKYPHNVGSAVRACSCYNSPLILFTGDRVSLESKGKKKGYRLPREERMKGYKDVTLLNDQYPFNRFSKDVVPVAVEVRDNAEYLPLFEHPKHAVYVFGPEDGSIPQIYLTHCQRFIVIPSNHCLNLSMAIGTVLYDRRLKEMLNGEYYPGRHT